MLGICAGAGIAQVAAQSGIKVVLSDVTPVSRPMACPAPLRLTRPLLALLRRPSSKPSSEPCVHSPSHPLPHRNGMQIITKSLGRIAKRAAPDDIEGFSRTVLERIETTTDA